MISAGASGLAPSAQHPLFEGRFSPYGCLAWFSRLLASPRPDWPILTRVVGFPFYAPRAADTGLDCCLSKFLERGAPQSSLRWAVLRIRRPEIFQS